MNEDKELKLIMEKARAQLKGQKDQRISPENIKITIPKSNLKLVYSYLTVYTLGLIMGVALTVLLFRL